MTIPALPEFLAGLDAAQAALPAAVNTAMGTTARVVAAAAEARAEALGSVAAKSAPDIHAVFGAEPAVVLDNAPGYVLGAEFGSDIYHQFKPHNPSGYFLGPAVEAAGPLAEKAVGDAVEVAARPAFPA